MPSSACALACAPPRHCGRCVWWLACGYCLYILIIWITARRALSMHHVLSSTSTPPAWHSLCVPGLTPPSPRAPIDVHVISLSAPPPLLALTACPLPEAHCPRLTARGSLPEAHCLLTGHCPRLTPLILTTGCQGAARAHLRDQEHERTQPRPRTEDAAGHGAVGCRWGRRGAYRLQLGHRGGRVRMGVYQGEGHEGSGCRRAFNPCKVP